MPKFAALLCVTALAGAAALGLAGCGSDDGEGTTTTASAPTATNQATSNAAFCSSLDDVQAAVDDVKGLNSDNISIAKVTEVATGLTTALAELTTASKDAVEVDSSELQSSFTQLKDDLLAIPGSGQGLSAGLASAKEALVPVEQALEDLKPDCESGGTTTTG